MLPRIKSVVRHAAPLLVLACLSPGVLPADEPGGPCLEDGGGQLAMQISGDFEAGLDWGNEGTRCDGGPRPGGDALRLMFSRDDDALLVVVAITGLERGVTGEGLPANLTVVRQGAAEFYGTLGAAACLVDVTENRPAASPDGWRVGGRGRCLAAIEAIGRGGEIRVDEFSFTGLAWWPDEED